MTVGVSVSIAFGVRLVEIDHHAQLKCAQFFNRMSLGGTGVPNEMVILPLKEESCVL